MRLTDFTSDSVLTYGYLKHIKGDSLFYLSSQIAKSNTKWITTEEDRYL